MNDLNGQKVELKNGATAWQPCMIASDSIGTGTNIGALSHIGRDVEIGNNCRIQGSVYIADGCKVGNEVFIGPSATLTNDRHPPSGGNWSPVVVEDKVVIGLMRHRGRSYTRFRLHNCSRSGNQRCTSGRTRQETCKISNDKGRIRIKEDANE